MNTPPTETSLLPCPFCGELPRYQPWREGHAPGYAWPHQILHNCKVTNTQTCVRTTRDTKEAVFAAWNTRTPDAATKELLEDKARLDLIESNSTLHKEVEILYLVDCYEVTILNDRNGSSISYRGETLRTAIDNAMKK